VLITGTSSGNQEATAEAFLADCWNVVATARNPSVVLPAVEHFRLLRRDLDLTNAQTIKTSLQEAESCFGSIDVVVTNARYQGEI
jgi:NADP-dependent 3-hydroxy acid dehydrogenase YdfG